ncbi:hypothetical protein D9619_012445 [Psilocybe cf. subviscida]|uniref:Uncharacterized protein n=1 Tax=Psilocybe cf. subviscida TaxID=2480587 RepID=A0A8H5AR39_9AGAR|nr:hypothetical protein D9619_012445 [Psilocybe cf. subviscida]
MHGAALYPTSISYFSVSPSSAWTGSPVDPMLTERPCGNAASFIALISSAVAVGRMDDLPPTFRPPASRLFTRNEFGQKNQDQPTPCRTPACKKSRICIHLASIPSQIYCQRKRLRHAISAFLSNLCTTTAPDWKVRSELNSETTHRDDGRWDTSFGAMTNDSAQLDMEGSWAADQLISPSNDAVTSILSSSSAHRQNLPPLVESKALRHHQPFLYPEPHFSSSPGEEVETYDPSELGTSTASLTEGFNEVVGQRHEAQAQVDLLDHWLHRGAEGGGPSVVGLG